MLTRSCDQSWAIVTIESNGLVVEFNEKAKNYFPLIATDNELKVSCPWFNEDWLICKKNARVIKAAEQDRMLLEIIRNQDKRDSFHLMFKRILEYRDVTHLWCELENSLIPLNPFINYFQDGVLIANENGIVHAVNQAFCLFTNTQEMDVIGREINELQEKGIIPECPITKALIEKRNSSEVIRFPNGKEAIVSSTLAYDKKGNIVHSISRICDITEIKILQGKLRAEQAKVENYQRELHSKQITEWMKLGHFHSRKMEELYDLVSRVANTDLPLMIMGESGVGKTALAKNIYMLGKKQYDGDFVHINCSAIPEALLESELFGYEEGAFTGANKVKIGLFEIARNGMIFFDEIGDMPLSLQGKLLNVLQEKKFYRVGSTRVISSNARILTATNKNLDHLVAEGRFRQDLFFRLNVIPLIIPPLRERKEDIISLVVNFLAESNKKYERSKILDEKTLAIILSYNWPGNIRQLQNVIDRIVVLTKGDIIYPKDLPPEITYPGTSNSSAKSTNNVVSATRASYETWSPGQPLKLAVSITEGQIIEQAVRYYGSVKEAAKKLGVDESTIARKRSKVNSLHN